MTKGHHTLSFFNFNILVITHMVKRVCLLSPAYPCPHQVMWTHICTPPHGLMAGMEHFLTEELDSVPTSIILC